MFSALLSTISGLIFAIVYFMAPREVAAEYSAIALMAAITVEILIKKFVLHKLSRFSLVIYAIIYCFTIPAIIFNDIKYIQLKFVVFKVCFALTLVIADLKYGVNVMERFFGKILRNISSGGWSVLNWGFAFYLASAAVISLLLQTYASPELWVIFKSILMPVYGALFMLFMLGYAVYDRKKHGQNASSAKNTQTD